MLGTRACSLREELARIRVPARGWAGIPAVLPMAREEPRRLAAGQVGDTWGQFCGLAGLGQSRLRDRGHGGSSFLGLPRGWSLHPPFSQCSRFASRCIWLDLSFLTNMTVPRSLLRAASPALQPCSPLAVSRGDQVSVECKVPGVLGTEEVLRRQLFHRRSY